MFDDTKTILYTIIEWKRAAQTPSDLNLNTLRLATRIQGIRNIYGI